MRGTGAGARVRTSLRCEGAGPAGRRCEPRSRRIKARPGRLAAARSAAARERGVAAVRRRRRCEEDVRTTPPLRRPRRDSIAFSSASSAAGGNRVRARTAALRNGGCAVPRGGGVGGEAARGGAVSAGAPRLVGDVGGCGLVQRRVRRHDDARGVKLPAESGHAPRWAPRAGLALPMPRAGPSRRRGGVRDGMHGGRACAPFRTRRSGRLGYCPARWRPATGAPHASCDAACAAAALLWGAAGPTSGPQSSPNRNTRSEQQRGAPQPPAPAPKQRRTITGAVVRTSCSPPVALLCACRGKSLAADRRRRASRAAADRIRTHVRGGRPGRARVVTCPLSTARATPRARTASPLLNQCRQLTCGSCARAGQPRLAADTVLRARTRTSKLG